MEASPEYEPSYTSEVEALLGTSFFYDAARTDALYEDFSSLAPEELGARQNIYISGLRVLAEARRDDRELSRRETPNLDVQLWNKNWQITPQTLGRIALQYRDMISPLARRLAIINNAERALDEGYAHNGLRDYQSPYLQDMVAGLQRAAEPVILPEWWQGDKIIHLQGTTVTAPTGIGKSALMARGAVTLGAGTMLPSYEGENKKMTPMRIAVIVPSQALIGRMLNETDEDIFHKLAPGIELGGYYQFERKIADVTFVTNYMFIAKFRDGKLDGVPMDALFIDEDQHVTGPELLTTLLNNWEGPTFGFSATPAYHPQKDARHILRNEIEHGDILDYIGRPERVLSDLQLFSLIIRPEDMGLGEEILDLPAAQRRELRQEAVAQHIKDFLRPLLAEGRKGLIFCEPGEESRHAQRVAALLREIELPDGSYVSAQAIGSFQGTAQSPENAKALTDYANGDVQVLTTTLMGHEGLHLPEVHFVVVACKITSPLKLKQIAGRGTKPSDYFGTTVLAQFNTSGFGQHQYYVQTLAGIFTNNVIEQGAEVQGSQQTSGGARDMVAITDFPEHIQHILERIDHKSVPEVYSSTKERQKPTIPPDYLPFSEVIAGTKVDPHHARYQLLRAGYRFKGQIELVEGRPTYVRYYEPTAKTYFTSSPEPPQHGVLQVELRGWVDRDEIYTADEIADALQVNKKVLLRDYMTDEEKQQGPERRINSHTKGRAWLKTDGDKIIERLSKKLFFPPHLVPVSAITPRLNARYNTVLEFVRRTREALGVEDVQRGKRTFPGLPWSAVQQLEERYGLVKGAEPIYFSALPTSADDDPDKIAYARYLQRMLLPRGWAPPRRH